MSSPAHSVSTRSFLVQRLLFQCVALQNGVHCPYAHGPTDLRAPTLDRDEVRVAQFEREILRLVSAAASLSNSSSSSAQVNHIPNPNVHLHQTGVDPMVTVAAVPANASQQSSQLVHSQLLTSSNGGATARAVINGGGGVGGPLESCGGASPGVAVAGAGLLAVAVGRNADLVQRLANLRMQLDLHYRRLVGARSAAQFDRAEELGAQQQQHAPLGHLDEIHVQWTGAPSLIRIPIILWL